MKLGLVLIVMLNAIQVMAVSASPFENFHSSVEAANEAYLQRDGTKLVLQIKEALTQHKNHPLIVENMTTLYTAAQKNGLFKGVQLDWTYPSEIVRMRFASKRIFRPYEGKVQFSLMAAAALRPGNSVEQMQVIRYPDQVVIDKLAGIGQWGIGIWGKNAGFWSLSIQSPIAVEEGLYLVNLKLANQSVVHGWFVFANNNASASPVIHSASMKGVRATRYPSFSWTGFRSPEFDPREEVGVSAKIIQADASSYVETVRADLSPSQESFQVGDKRNAMNYRGAFHLETGPYLFEVEYRERNVLGGLHIDRISSTRIPFLTE